MNSTRSTTLCVLTVAALALAACGGGSDSSEGTDTDGGDSEQGGDDGSAGDDADAGAGDDSEAADDSSDVIDEAPEGSEADVVDPVYHHASATSPANSYGPLCNADNVRDWAPGWRITVPEGWTFSGSGGSNSFYDIRFNTPDDFLVKVEWTQLADSFGYLDGTPVGDIDFDAETVALMDSSDDTNTILAIDYLAQSVGGLAQATGGGPSIHQVAILAPTEMGMTQDDLSAILTSMQRERCAIFEALGVENAFQLGAVLPLFDGGDPLGKTLPTSERMAFDPGWIINRYAAYTDDQLAYIVGFDQATSECFVANLKATLPTEVADLVMFADPISPTSDDGVAAQQAALVGC